MRAREEGVHRDDGAVLRLDCLVSDEGYQHAPSGIRDAFSETVVLDHAFDAEGLDADDLAVIYKTAREFMVMIPASISDMSMDESDAMTGLGPILRALLRATERLLAALQDCLPLSEVLRISDLTAVRKND